MAELGVFEGLFIILVDGHDLRPVQYHYLVFLCFRPIAASRCAPFSGYYYVPVPYTGNYMLKVNAKN